MTVTLKTIAEICNIDISTVSRALRNDPRVKADTRELICQKATELGYNPNLAARQLVSGRTLNLWMIIPDLKQMVVQEPAQYLSETLNRQGYDLLITLYQNNTKTFSHLLSRLSQNVADGAFIIPSTDYGMETYAPLLKKRFPIVFIDRKPDFPECSTVTSANSTAASDLTEKCINAGGNRFVVLFNEDNSAARARLTGAIDCLNRAGIPFITGNAPIPEHFTGNNKIAILASSSGSIEQFYQANSSVLQTGKMIVGVFDAWLSGLSENYSHIFICKQNFQTISARAAELMLRKIDKKSDLFTTIEIPATQIITLKSVP
ncbi:MAG: LacI family DNA-binding transcriptional regulator [Victivallaceae bacterium]